MTAETEDLVLELLRGMRGDIAAFRGETEKRFTAIETRLTGLDERIDAIETQLEGIRYVLVGSVATDLKDHETRIAALEASEGARV